MSSFHHEGYLTTRDKIFFVIIVVVTIPVAVIGWPFLGLVAFFGICLWLMMYVVFGEKRHQRWKIGRQRFGHLRKEPDRIRHLNTVDSSPPGDEF